MRYCCVLQVPYGNDLERSSLSGVESGINDQAKKNQSFDKHLLSMKGIIVIV